MTGILVIILLISLDNGVFSYVILDHKNTFDLVYGTWQSNDLTHETSTLENVFYKEEIHSTIPEDYIDCKFDKNSEFDTTL